MSSPPRPHGGATVAMITIGEAECGILFCTIFDATLIVFSGLAVYVCDIQIKNEIMLQDHGYRDCCKLYRDTYRGTSIAMHRIIVPTLLIYGSPLTRSYHAYKKITTHKIQSK